MARWYNSPLGDKPTDDMDERELAELAEEDRQLQQDERTREWGDGL